MINIIWLWAESKHSLIENSSFPLFSKADYKTPSSDFWGLAKFITFIQFNQCLSIILKGSLLNTRIRRPHPPNYTVYTEELLVWTGPYTKGLQAQPSPWWPEPKLLVLQSISKSPWPINSNCCSNLVSISQDCFWPPCSLWLEDKNTHSTHGQQEQTHERWLDCPTSSLAHGRLCLIKEFGHMLVSASFVFQKILFISNMSYSKSRRDQRKRIFHH